MRGQCLTSQVGKCRLIRGPGPVPGHVASPWQSLPLVLGSCKSSCILRQAGSVRYDHRPLGFDSYCPFKSYLMGKPFPAPGRASESLVTLWVTQAIEVPLPHDVTNAPRHCSNQKCRVPCRGQNLHRDLKFGLSPSSVTPTCARPWLLLSSLSPLTSCRCAGPGFQPLPPGTGTWHRRGSQEEREWSRKAAPGLARLEEGSSLSPPGNAGGPRHAVLQRSVLISPP